MTFTKFEELFKTKYPNGKAIQHGKFGGTEKNKKTTIVFSPNGKCYEYYGAYEDILCRIGIKTISKSRLHDFEAELERCKRMNGQKAFFCETLDYSEKIAWIENELSSIRSDYIIV